MIYNFFSRKKRSSTPSKSTQAKANIGNGENSESIFTDTSSLIQKQSNANSISEQLSNLAEKANFAYNSGSPQAPQLLSELLETCWGKGGHILLDVDSKRCMSVGLAFAYTAVGLNWNDKDFNSVAAENAFYCLSKNLLVEQNTFSAPALFTLLLNYPNLLKDKLIATHCAMAEKQIGMSIGMMLGGDPFNAPHLQDFRNQAVAYRIAIMNHLISFFYDTNSDTFTIPTDLPYLLPSKSDIRKFKNLLLTVSDAYVGIDQGEQYFNTMFKECEHTLDMCR